MQTKLSVMTKGLCSATLCAVFLPGQSMPLPRSIESGELLTVAQRSVGVHRDGDRVCGIGPDYQATFDSDGVEFRPAFGADAPRTTPWSFHLESIHRGTRVLYQRTHAVVPQILDTTVWYDRDGVIERYEMRPDGVEQSFVFAAPPPGRGEIVVRGRVRCDLPSDEHGTVDAGLRFVQPGLGGVRIGAVLGIDASGHTAAGRIRFDGEHLELTLPATMVDVASYPLVLDPLISAVFDVSSPNSGQRDLYPDVAHEVSSNLYLVVWQRSLSSLDADILGQRFDHTGNPVGNLLLIDSSPDVGFRPAVASVDLGDAFFVVWRHATSPFGPWGVQGRTVLSTGAMSPGVAIAPTTVDAGDPDVGGQVTLSDDRAVVVWNENATGTIYARHVDIQALAVPVLGSPQWMSGGGGETVRIEITKSAGRADRHMIIIERERSATASQLWAWVCDESANLLQQHIVTPQNEIAQHPSVDGNGTDFMVVYEKPESAGATDHDIFAQRLRYDGSQVTTPVPETRIEFGNPGNDEFRPAVSYLGNKWLVACVDEDTGFNFHAYVRALNDNCQPCGSWELVSSGALVNGAPQIGSRYSGEPRSRFLGGSNRDQAMIVFQSGAVGPPFDSRIRGRLFEGIGNGGTVVQLGSGCGAGGTITTNGPVAIGNAGFAFDLAGAGPSSVLYGLGLGNPGATLTCGACNFVDGSYNFVLPTRPLGSARYALPIPCRANLLGFRLDAQWIAFGTTASPCRLAATLSASNRIRVTVGL